jgi:hypothetical protein
MGACACSKGCLVSMNDVVARVLVGKWGMVLILGIRALAADLCNSAHPLISLQAKSRRLIRE